MNPVQIIATLRKFGNYLAGIFPLLALVADRTGEWLKARLSHPALAPFWQRLYQYAWVQALWKIIERFYWRTYSKDRLDLTSGPAECIPVLRSMFQLCVLICLLVPLCSLRLFPVAIETLAGFKSTVPAPFVYIWIVCLPLAWAALLTGAALSNRLVLLAASLFCLYFTSTCVIFAGRAWSNALLGLAVLHALYISQRALDSKKSPLAVLTLLVVCMAAGVEMTVLTPLRPLVGPFIENAFHPPKEAIGIGVGCTLGIFIAAFVFTLAKKAGDKAVDMGRAVFYTYLPLLAFLLLLLPRADLGQAAGMLLSSLTMTTSYFWPVWYFIGIGIVHKLMGSTRVVVQAVEKAVPQKVLVPLALMSLTITLIASFSDRLAYYFAGLSGPIANSLCTAFAALYHLVQPVFFASTTGSIGTHWLSLVLLVDLIVIAVLSFSRRLTARAVTSLFYSTCLAALLIWEYLFQYGSFARTPGHNVLAVFFFCLWLLWLMHTVGWSTSMQGSPLWPVRGRLAIYTAVVMFALLEIQIRTAAQDYRVMNEIFLYMFKGVIDVGLPYYLYIWATRRVKPLPTSIKSIFYAFCLGALSAFALNPLDKLAAVEYRPSAWLALIDGQLAALSSTGNVALDINLPLPWLLARAFVFTGLMLALLAIAGRGRKLPAATSAFLLMSFAGGLASFSKSFVDLPLPTYVRVIFAPLTQEPGFNAAVFNAYLAAWLPALILSYALFKGERAGGKLPPFTVLFAVMANFAITAIFLQCEPWLRASSLLYPYLTLTACAFTAMVVLVMQELKESSADKSMHTENQEETLTVQQAEVQTAPDSKSGQSLVNPILTQKNLLAITAVVAVSTLVVTLTAPRLTLEDKPSAALTHPIRLDRAWKVFADTKDATVYTRPAGTGKGAIFGAGKVPAEPGKDKFQILKDLMIKAASGKNFPDMQVLQIASYERYAKGALVCRFSYSTPTGTKMPMSGVTVLVPRENLYEYYTLLAMPSEIERMEWELALAVRK